MNLFSAFIIFGDWGIDFVTVNFVPLYRFLLYKKEWTKIRLYRNKRSWFRYSLFTKSTSF